MPCHAMPCHAGLFMKKNMGFWTHYDEIMDHTARPGIIR